MFVHVSGWSCSWWSSALVSNFGNHTLLAAVLVVMTFLFEVWSEVLLSLVRAILVNFDIGFVVESL